MFSLRKNMVQPIPIRHVTPIVIIPRRRRLAVIRLGGTRRKHQLRWRLSFLRRLHQVVTYKNLIRRLSSICKKLMTDMIEGPVGDTSHMPPRISIVSSYFTTPFMSVPDIRQWQWNDLHLGLHTGGELVCNYRYFKGTLCKKPLLSLILFSFSICNIF